MFPRYPDRPLTGDPREMIRGGDFGDLVSKVNEFRVINGLPLGNPEVEIQEYICRNTGAECVPANPAKPMPGFKPKGAMVARFLYAMAQWMANGGHVSQEEAEQRAERCSNCAYNTDIDDAATCSGCFGMAAKIMQVIGDRKTKMDASLKFCGVCGCSNAVQAFVPLDVLAKAHNLVDFPDDVGVPGEKIPCWKREWADAQKNSTNVS